VKNEYNLLYVDKDGGAALVIEDGAIKEYRSEGQVISDGRRLINAGTAVRFKVLKVVAEHS
jgi:hypothetical protein